MNIPKKTSAKSRMKLTDALNNIYKTSKQSGLKEPLFRSLKNELTIVSKYIDADRNEALIFSVVCSMNLFGENVEPQDLVRYFDVSPFEMIDYLNCLASLSDKSILIKRKNRRRFDDTLRKHYFIVNPKIMDAIISNEAMPENIEVKINDVFEVLERVNEVCQDCISETIDSTDMYEEIDEIIENNKQFGLIQQIENMDLELVDRIVYYYVIWKSVNGSLSVDMDEPMSSFFRRSSNRVQYLQNIFNGSNKLIKNNLVEYNSGRFFNDIDLCLTDESIKLLNQNGIILTQRKKGNRTITPDQINSKELFYEAEEKANIQELHAMMDNDCYLELMNRLGEKSLPQNLNILLFGAPGTGKTETVMQLAKASGREILKVEISQSKSMWFGESEKLIKKIFRDYQDIAKQTDKAPILLFNEADAILSSRKSNVSSSVSQTENAMQNILLEELENFSGIFIATTNLAGNLDKAFDRRFLYKIEFSMPGVSARQSIWKSKLTGLTDAEALILAKENHLSGGQNDNVIRKAEIQFLLKGNSATLDELLAFCEQEIILQKATARIGFTSK